ncbi:DUF354 domain-containing protein [Candidatus Woesearchaeota archaeon]|nr:DUF354 domain-containing protein [Candidatus Woesearchaeota archaeon]
MNILFDINHPADVHQFRYVIDKLTKKHDVKVIARDKDCVYSLLRYFNIPFIKRNGYDGLLGKIFGMIFIDLKLIKISLRFKPDVLVGSSGNVYVAQAGKFLGIPSVVFEDTEHSKLQNKLCFPFATKIVTPESFKLDLGKKQVRYPGSKELCYLSSDYFVPDKKIKKKLGKGKIIFLRFVSWKASHDIGKKGISNKKKLVKRLSKLGKVVISSEEKLPEALEKYELKDCKNKIHDCLYYSDIVISEGATIAAEAAVLKRPVIYANELSMGYTDELIKKEMMAQVTDDERIIELAKNLILEKNKPKKLKTEFDLNEFMAKEILKCAK